MEKPNGLLRVRVQRVRLIGIATLQTTKIVGVILGLL